VEVDESRSHSLGLAVKFKQYHHLAGLKS